MKVGARDVLFLGVVLGGTGSIGAGLWHRPTASTAQAPPATRLASDIEPIVAQVDATFAKRWTGQKMVPAERASDMVQMRRLSLALCGTVPSLEEIRRFEARPKEGRLEEWLDGLLHDRRCTDYLAERLARAYVGTEDGPFIVFRRRRFIAWLSDMLLENRRYDGLVRDLIADSGLWTDHPATNFVSVTHDPEFGKPDSGASGCPGGPGVPGRPHRLRPVPRSPVSALEANRFPRAGLVFRRRSIQLAGHSRRRRNEYRPPDKKTREPVTVEPCVPFRAELKPGSGSPREQLAAWVTNPRNDNFSQATVNRVWALLLGRPLAEPVDDLPAVGTLDPVLVQLAGDFASHGFNLRRLIRVVAATQVFQQDSEFTGTPADDQEEAWAVFPMTRLRPEQVAGALFQAGSVTTLGSQSHWFIRLVTYTGRNDFVKRYGDTGEDEFDARAGTIPQRLLLMNGEIVRDKIKDGFFTAAGRIADLRPTTRVLSRLRFSAS